MINRFRWVCLVFSISMVVLGCEAQQPSVGITDPAIFTMAHMAAVNLEFETDTPNTGQREMRRLSVKKDLERYFRQSTTTYADTKLRMDEMLDSSQRSRSIAQLVSLTLTLQGKVNLSPTSQPAAPRQPTTSPTQTADTTSGTTATEGITPSKPGDGTTTADANKPGNAGAQADAGKPSLTADEVQKLSEALSASVDDSPFDRLDRARDFYTSYLLKVLPAYGHDSRALDVENLRFRPLRDFPLRVKAFNDGIPIEIQPTMTPEDVHQKWDEDVELLERAVSTAASDVDAARSKSKSASASIDDFKVALRTAEREAKLWLKLQEIAEGMKNGKGMVTDDEQVRQFLQSQLGNAPTTQAVEEYWQARHREDAQKTRERDFLDAQKALDNAIDQSRVSVDNATAKVEKLKGDLLQKKREARAITKALYQSQPATRASNTKRLLLFVTQVHVNPGTAANQMTGVRIKLVGAGAKGGSGEVSVDDVKIISVHPTRNYDLEDDRIVEKSIQAVRAALEVNAPRASGNVDSDSKAESEERQRFLSRITKVASFADAANHEVGWNFYPTNLQTVRRSGFERLGDFFTLSPSRPFEVRAFLEGGARDCAFYALVPQNLDWITMRVDYVNAAIDSRTGPSRETRWHVAADGVTHAVPLKLEVTASQLQVTLPPWDPKEDAAFFLTGDEVLRRSMDAPSSQPATQTAMPQPASK